MSLAVSAQLLLALSLLPIVTCGSGEDIDRILQDTVTLDPRVRPVKNLSTTTTVVEVSFHLISIAAFDTVEQRLVSNGYLSVRWDNEYFNWLPLNYGNIYVVSPDPDKIWRPTLTVMNTMKELKPIGENYVLLTALYQRYNVLVSCRSLRNLLQSGCDLLSLRHTGNVRVQLACCLPNLTDEASIVNKLFPALHSCKRQILFHVRPTYYLGIGEKQSYLTDCVRFSVA